MSYLHSPLSNASILTEKESKWIIYVEKGRRLEHVYYAINAKVGSNLSAPYTETFILCSSVFDVGAIERNNL